MEFESGRVLVGAKTGVLAYADGDIPAALRQVTAAGIVETTDLVERLYPGWSMESAEGEILGEGTYPADGLAYAASFPGVDVVCDRRLHPCRPASRTGRRRGAAARPVAGGARTACRGTAMVMLRSRPAR